MKSVDEQLKERGCAITDLSMDDIYHIWKEADIVSSWGDCNGSIVQFKDGTTRKATKNEDAVKEMHSFLYHMDECVFGCD